MDDKDRIEELEAALARMLQPMKGVPFVAIIRALTGCRVLPVDTSDPTDTALIDKIKNLAHSVGEELQSNPIFRPRPNEVGNDIEPYVLRGLEKYGMVAARPTDASGRGQSTGYPDILTKDTQGNSVYIECKIYSANTKGTSMRSFYLSPSNRPKVTTDAKHLLLAFEMTSESVSGSEDSSYTSVGYTLIDLYGLNCDVKYEFNANNKSLYKDDMILASEMF